MGGQREGMGTGTAGEVAPVRVLVLLSGGVD